MKSLNTVEEVMEAIKSTIQDTHLKSYAKTDRIMKLKVLADLMIKNQTMKNSMPKEVEKIDKIQVEFIHSDPSILKAIEEDVKNSIK